MSKTNNILVASAISGVFIGWVMKNSISKRQQRVEYKPMLDMLKRKERNMYEEGRKRANELSQIKQEITNKVVQ